MVEPDCPYAVHLARSGRFRTVALDFDFKRGYLYVEVERQATLASKLLAKCGFRPVVVSTDGGFHVLATLADPVWADEIGPIIVRLARRFPALDPSPMMNPATGAIRPPGALHRSGARSSVVSGTLRDLQEGTFSAALEKLDRELLPDAANSPRGLLPATVSGDRTTNGLSPRIDQLLRNGDTTHQYLSRSEVVQAIATNAVRAGWSQECLFEALTDPANKGGAKLQRMKARGARKYIARSYLKAASYVKVEARLDEILERLRLHISTITWPGQAGATDLVVYRALLAIAERAKKLRFSASSRELAEIAAVGRTTAAKSVRRLIERGCVRLARRGERGDPHIYEFVLDAVSRGRAAFPPRVFEGAIATPSLDHEAFARKGLGPNGGRVYRYLQSLPETCVTPVAEALGIDVSTARRNLRKLESAGLASVRDGIWIAIPKDLDEVAAELGVTGLRVRKRQRHDEERKLFALARKVRN
jgi:DNA-binding MarR family transcriptional regulator